MDIKLDTEKLKAGLVETFKTDEFAVKFAKLKEFDFNPFSPPAPDDDPDSPQGWNKIKEATQLVNEIIIDILTVVEQVAYDSALIASGQAKLNAVCGFIDDVISLPFWAEPFDGPIIKLMVNQLVGLLNRLFGHDWISKIPIPVGKPAIG